jgi:hypothetical protein
MEVEAREARNGTGGIGRYEERDRRYGFYREAYFVKCGRGGVGNPYLSTGLCASNRTAEVWRFSSAQGGISQRGTLQYPGRNAKRGPRAARIAGVSPAAASAIIAAAGQADKGASDTHIGQYLGDPVYRLDQFGVGCFQSVDRRGEAGNRQRDQARIFLFTRRFVR